MNAQLQIVNSIYYGIESDNINAVIVQDSTIWSISDAGLTKLSIASNVSYTYNFLNSPMPVMTASLMATSNSLVIDNNKNLWIANAVSGISKFDGINWTLYDSTNSPAQIQNTYCLYVDSLNILYIGTATGLLKFNGQVFDSLPEIFPGQYEPPVNKILFKGDTLWCATERGLAKFDGFSWTLYNPPATGSIYNNIKEIASGLNDAIWLTTFLDGELYKFEGGVFTHFTRPSSSPINKITTDSLGNVWTIPSGNNGIDNKVTMFDGINYYDFDSSNFGTIKDLNYINFTHGNLWLAGDKFVKNDKGLWKSYNFKTNPLNLIPKECAVDKDNSYWIADGKLLHLNNEGEWNSFDSIFCKTICIDTNGTKWVGGKGFGKYDSGNIFQLLIPNINVLDIALDSLQNLWISSFEDGLYYYDHNTITKYDSSNSGLKSVWPNKIEVDKLGKVYVGTYGNGLFTFDGSIWENFNSTNSGLADNNVGEIRFDSQNAAYIRTGLGINKKNQNNWTLITSLIGTPLEIDSNDIIYFDNNYYDGIRIHEISKLFPYYITDITFDRNNDIVTCEWDGVTIFSFNHLPATHYPQIIGRVFYDGLNNGIPDSLDIGMFNQKVISYPDSEIAFTNSYGNYAFGKTPGNYTVEFLPKQDWFRTSDSSTYTVTLNNRDTTGFDFQTYAVNPKDSISIFITYGIPRCDTDVPFWIHYSNNGTTLLNGQIKIAADSQLGYLFSVPPPDTITADTLVWNFTNLYPGQQKQIDLGYSLSSSAVFGDSLSFNAWAEINNLNFLSVNSHYSVFCSYDPNDKTVSPTGITDNHLTHFNVPLDYTVRFQNCGNDTAFNVSIVDTLDANLDLSTFDFEASSHPVYTTLSPQGVLKFRFDDILLPCLTTNALESEGFVRYKISPKNNLPDPTQIENFAGIYFDRNPPIFTNQTWNTLTNNFPTTSVNYIVAPSNEVLTVYPNPATENIKIVPSMSEAYQLAIFDSRGRQLLSNHYSGEQSIPVNNFKTGIYFYQVMFEKGNRSTGKIVIE